MDRRPEIYFESWQASENNNYAGLQPGGGYSNRGGRLEQLWDNYRDQMLLEEILPPETIQKFYQARILLGSNRGIRPAKDRPQIFNDPLDFDPASIGDIFVIRFWSDEAVEKYKDEFRFWMDEVAHAASSVGGDDSYFDYYPDNWMVALQIAKALGMKEDYTKYRDIAYNLRYADDPDDNLPEWSEG